MPRLSSAGILSCFYNLCRVGLNFSFFFLEMKGRVLAD